MDEAKERSVESLLKSIKKNCRMCSTYKTFNPNGKEKPIVLASLKELYNIYKDEYEILRKKEIEAEEIRKSIRNRRLCLDITDACNSCDKEVPKAQNMSKGIEK